MDPLVKFESTIGKCGTYRSATVYQYDEETEGWPVRFFTDDGYDPCYYVYAPLSKAIDMAKEHCNSFDADDYMYNDDTDY